MSDYICTICQQQTNNYTTDCNHSFCSDCITDWIFNYSPTCPICRTKINFNDFNEFNEFNDGLITEIGSKNIHQYSLNNCLLNILLNYQKGLEYPITTSERELITKMFNFTVGKEISRLYNNNWICKINGNILIFGKKINLNNVEYKMDNSFVLVRDDGSFFPVHPPNRIYKYRDNDQFYLCHN